MTLKLPTPRAILFDWDNTLVDTWPLIHAAMNMTLRHYNMPEWSMEKVLSEVKLSMRDAFPALFGDKWKEAGEFYSKSYRSIHLEQLKEIPGAETFLAGIRSDIFIALVSNKQGGTLRLEVPKLGWDKYFAVCIGAGDAPRDKPHADPALLALKDSGIEAGPHVWFVGDTGADLGCAQAAGFTPILFHTHGVAEDTFDGYSFAAQVDTHEALGKLINSAR